MKKVIKALWQGIKAVFTAVVDWVSKLFGMYPEGCPEKTDEKQREEDIQYARSLRITVSTAFTAVVVVWALILLIRFGQTAYHGLRDLFGCDEESEYYLSEDISEELSFYESCNDNTGYIANSKGKKIIKNVNWIFKPLEGDSLICYSDGEHRGYFHMRDGKIVIPPTYNHAWIFSEGLAAVELNGRVKFINTEGNVVIDHGFAFDRWWSDGYVFHNGHCAVNDSTGNYMGLIDHDGKWVLPPIYKSIIPVDTFWIVSLDEQQAIFTFSMDTVMPMTDASFEIEGSSILATFSDHTQAQFTLQGELVTASQIRSVEQLMYETREVLYPDKKDDEFNDEYYSYSNPAKRMAVATCLRYETEYGWYGLMNSDGRILTPPSYVGITALDKDLYLCETSFGRGVMINSKGVRVK